MTPGRVNGGPVRRDGVLHLDDVDLGAIAARFDTPCFVYSQSQITAAYGAYADALGKRGRVFYAVKANPSHAILTHLAQLGAGFDIVSGGELARVLAAGGDAAAIVFSGVGKTDHEISAALAAGVGCFNVESHSELRRLSAIASASGQQATVALRVNPDIEAATHRHIATGGSRHKFGIAQEAAAALAVDAARLPGIALQGLAMHIGSQIVDPAPIADGAARLARMAQDLNRQGVTIRRLDLGGGLGVGPAAPAVADYVELLLKATGPDFEIMLEPGRSIVAEAGVMLTRVICIKHNAQRSFAVVDAGMNDFLRPALYDAWHDIVVVDDRNAPPGATYEIVGPVCESGDTLGHARQLALREGTLLALLQAGAYGATMSSHYNSRPRCAEIFACAGQARLIRKRETLAGMLRDETELDL